jgi:hypothetical protein
MTTVAFYRDEAKRYRVLAAEESDPTLKAQLLTFARDHDTLADILEEAEGATPPPPARAPRQPTQQQPQKKQEDKE